MTEISIIFDTDNKDDIEQGLKLFTGLAQSLNVSDDEYNAEEEEQQKIKAEPVRKRGFFGRK